MKTGLCCKLASLAAVLCADSTFTHSRAFCNAVPNTRKVLITENTFASSAIVGAFADSIVREIKANVGRRTPYFSEARKLTEKSSYAIHVAMALENNHEGIPCLDRAAKFLFSTDPGSRVVGRIKSHFNVNPNRKIYSRQPNILYIVSDRPMDQVFSGGDYALSPPRNGTLKAFRSIEDAIDSHDIAAANEVHIPTHRR